jgi:hypothetical protein
MVGYMSIRCADDMFKEFMLPLWYTYSLRSRCSSADGFFWRRHVYGHRLLVSLTANSHVTLQLLQLRADNYICD